MSSATATFSSGTGVFRWGIVPTKDAGVRLAEFILHDMEAIVAQWEAFAATLHPAATGMAPLALRDHAQPILEAVAKDLGTPQTREAQSEKSRGRAPTVAGAPETAAQTHAVLRARDGFDINQLVAEYRALRASVLRLWLDAGALDETGVEDVIRFNEAIDQAVAESVGHFHAQVERTRNLFLGMLGHDMRSPLQTIQATAARLAALNAGDQVSAAAARLIRSGAAMQALLDDLVDFNRARLGLGIRVVPSDLDSRRWRPTSWNSCAGRTQTGGSTSRRPATTAAGGTPPACSSCSATSSRMPSGTGPPTGRSAWRCAARGPTCTSKSRTGGRPSNRRI